jgi:hypothetical protein
MTLLALARCTGFLALAVLAVLAALFGLRLALAARMLAILVRAILAAVFLVAAFRLMPCVAFLVVGKSYSAGEK